MLTNKDNANRNLNDPGNLNQKAWKPHWWKEETHGSAWDRVKEAMARDWIQTKHDFNSKSGHELNQELTDTVRQMAGSETIPPIDQANPPKVIGQLGDNELPMRYGYGARQQYGASYPTWSPTLEAKLRAEWLAGAKTGQTWEQVREQIRYGYEHKSV